MIKLLILLITIPSLALAHNKGPYSHMQQVTAKIENKSGHIGAGVVVSPNGLIITANHLTTEPGWPDHKLVTVTLNNKTYTGVVKKDIYSEFIDICFIKIPAIDLKYAKVENWGSYGIGDSVYTLGHPLAFDFVVSKGIIGQFHEDGRGQKIMVDMTINQGNSGGGLFNEEGGLIGVIIEVPVATRNQIEHNSGYGIAISSDNFKDLVEEYDK